MQGLGEMRVVGPNLARVARSRPLAAFAACVIAAGCASTAAPPIDFTPNADAAVWPKPPEAARYAYAGEVIGEADFVTARSQVRSGAARVLRAIAGLVVGKRKYGELRRPIYGFRDADGAMIVADMSLRAVVKFDFDQSKFIVWRLAADTETFEAPSAVVSDGAGGVYVSDAEKAEVFHLSASGDPVGRLGADTLKRPLGLAREPVFGDLFVSDGGDHTIKKFSASGHLLAVFGGPGLEKGQFNTPTHLAFHDGALYVADTFNFRVQKLTSKGEPILAFGENGLKIGDMARPKGIAIGGDGRIYVVESLYGRLLVFNPDGRLLMTLAGKGRYARNFYLPSGVWTDSSGHVFVADMFNGRVVAYQELTPLAGEGVDAGAP